MTLAIALPLSAARSDTLPDPNGPGDGFLHFPGMPPIPMRPQDRAFDPSGALTPEPGDPARRARVEQAKPATPQTPAEKADAITKALAPRPPLAVVRKRSLDELYTKLAAARDEDEAKGLAELIGSIWMRSDSDTANLLMQRAVTAIEAKNYPLALQVLDRLVDLQPNWPESWNKRASVRFFAGDIDGSMADVDHVLKLEPRHFGALDGMATILQSAGLNKRALEVYRRSLAVYPHQAAVEKIVEKLTLEVEGQGI
ncbi:M48 family metallopeptidase [Beijerinckia sp. L45]|uniref:tetratricopeptide repeat protein n=1 Tax=Beijerinckia sp. L45 TaxID=1641855 RepID=UPI00131AEFE3|nr:tetratricopeptide repeat protein [Beijerinckia sp. L45]